MNSNSNNNTNNNSVQRLNLQVYGHQVSGKSPKFTDKSQKYIYKAYSQSQTLFFQQLSKCGIMHRSYQLKKFIPQFLGVFTQSQILHEEDIIISTPNHCSTITNTQQKQYNQQQQLQPISQIIQQQLPTLQTVSQRKQWIEHINSRSIYQKNQKFLKLKNLTYGYKYPNVMDIKLGIKKSKKKQSSKKLQHNTTKSHGFRINGLSVRQFDYNNQHNQSQQYNNSITDDNSSSVKQRFMSKYYCQKITQQQLNRHLAFFLFDGQKVHIQLLIKFIQKLKQIILGFLAFTDIQFQSSSIYLAYDAYDPTKYTINFIDFDKYHQQPGVDKSVQLGLKSCLRHFIQIEQDIRSVQKQLLNKQLMYFNEQHDVVPKQKVKQYQIRSKKNIRVMDDGDDNVQQ